MNITHIYTGNDLKSHFEIISPENMHSVEFGNMSQPYLVEHLFFRTNDPANDVGWHNAPRSQYIVYLSGEFEIELSDGETRKFTTGDILLFEDLQGKGHKSRCLQKGEALVITVKKPT